MMVKVHLKHPYVSCSKILLIDLWFVITILVPGGRLVAKPEMSRSREWLQNVDFLIEQKVKFAKEQRVTAKRRFSNFFVFVFFRSSHVSSSLWSNVSKVFKLIKQGARSDCRRFSNCVLLGPWERSIWQLPSRTHHIWVLFGPIWMHIYDKQCEIMPKNQWVYWNIWGLFTWGESRRSMQGGESTSSNPSDAKLWLPSFLLLSLL